MFGAGAIALATQAKRNHPLRSGWVNEAFESDQDVYDPPTSVLTTATRSTTQPVQASRQAWAPPDTGGPPDNRPAETGRISS